jgi:hypothetical protein
MCVYVYIYEEGTFVNVTRVVDHVVYLRKEGGKEGRKGGRRKGRT